MAEAERPSRGLATDLRPARLRRQWQVIAERTRARTRSTWLRYAVAVAACAVAALGLLFWQHRASSPSELRAGAVLESFGNHPRTVTLDDGSQIVLGAQSKVRLLSFQGELVDMEVERGAADFDVVPQDGRHFRVRAGSVRVAVVGTRFRVEILPGAREYTVRVAVERGAVQVLSESGAVPVRLQAGQSWAAAFAIGSPVPPFDAANPESQPNRPAKTVPPPTSADGPARAVRVAASALQHEPIRSAKELLEAAEAASLSGRPADAAAAYDELRRRFPGDGRAGLAAFELGRLELERLGRPAAAAGAFRSAVALAPGAPFREDAEARLVQALEAAGEQEACAKAKATYLARYPGGTHATSVRQRCGPTR